MPRNPKAAEPRANRAKTFKEWLGRECGTQAVSRAELARRAGVSPSTISMLWTKNRLPSSKVAFRVAEALCPADQNFRNFVGELEGILGRRLVAEHAAEPTAERVVREKKIRVGAITYLPFVSAGKEGFAVDLLRRLGRVICQGEFVLDIQSYEWNDLEKAVQESDLVISGIIPTFRRSLFMSFTRPLPFLWVPVTALMRKDRQIAVDELLNWETNRSLGDGTRMLVIAGEIGDEFARVYLGLDSNDSSRITRVESHNNADLYAALTEPTGPALLLADYATCAEVLNFRDGRERFTPIKPIKSDSGSIALGSTAYAELAFPTIAKHRLVFGAKPDDAKPRGWVELVNRAIDSLLTEGLAPTIALYDRYASHPLFGELFHQLYDRPEFERHVKETVGPSN